MPRRLEEILMSSTRSAAVTVALLTALSAASPLGATDQTRISGPFVHHNLAIYLVHGTGSGGPVPLTLEEALLGETVKVRETGEVNALEIENVGGEPVFVQSGDIVKGGQQDRALTASLLLPPRSGRIRIAAFCVEHGRWSARGREDATRFSTAHSVLPSREAKIAMKAPASPHPQTGAVRAETGRRQADVWRNVATTQERLSGSLGAPVASPRSQTSLQLTLENAALEKAAAQYVEALQPAGGKEADVIGYVFAINGKLNSADLYASNGLFRKMWPKLLRAGAAEAIGEQTAASVPPPSIEEVASFLQAAERGARAEQEIIPQVRLETRDSAAAYYFETRSAIPSAPAATWIHRNYLAK
jgi:hypothetical protein